MGPRVGACIGWQHLAWLGGVLQRLEVLLPADEVIGQVATLTLQGTPS